MHRIIGDKATPKTGGVTNRAHTKRIARKACLHKFNPPVPPAGYPGLSRSVPPPKKCETNPIRAVTASRRPLFQQNEPNLNRSGPVEDQKCETNPISARPIMRNEPNSNKSGVSLCDIRSYGNRAPEECSRLMVR